MSTFEYHAKDKAGKDVKGVQDAEDSSELVRKLKAQGYLVVRVNEVKKAQSFFSITRAPASKGTQGKSGNIKLDDLVVFARQMATLVSAGIPLIQSLDDSYRVCRPCRGEKQAGS